jgi:hypothetical protein
MHPSSLQRLEIVINLTTAISSFLLKKNLDFYGTMCHGSQSIYHPIRPIETRSGQSG